MVRIDRIEGAAADDLLRWMFGKSSPSMEVWSNRLQATHDQNKDRFLLFRAATSKETAAGFLFYQATPKGPAHLLEWHLSDAWRAIDPKLSFRSVASAAINAGAGWVQWNRMEGMPAMPGDSWWQPDFTGDLVHWEKQLRDTDAKSERCNGEDSQRPAEPGSWQVFLLKAKELTSYLADFVGTMQHHSDFPELDQQIDPEGWIAEQLVDGEASWAVLAVDTRRSPQEVGGLVLWHLDSKMGWEMRWLGVKPRWRGRGLASHLVQQSLQLLGERQLGVADLPSDAPSTRCEGKARSFWVSCDGRNRPMIGLLEKLKFCPIYQSSLLFWWRDQATFHA